MNLTYLSGGVGLFIGFNTVSGDDPSLSAATLIGVGLTGLLSFFRHSVFHASDAKRMGWDLGRRNNFQIEVGIANLAWGALAIFAVALDWGLRTEAASFLVFGFYMLGVAAMMAGRPGQKRGAAVEHSRDHRRLRDRPDSPRASGNVGLVLPETSSWRC